MLVFRYALVVQWIEREFAELVIEVRFLTRAQDFVYYKTTYDTIRK